MPRNKVYEVTVFNEIEYKSVHIGDHCNTVIFLKRKGLTKKKEKQFIAKWKADHDFFTNKFTLFEPRPRLLK